MSPAGWLAAGKPYSVRDVVLDELAGENRSDSVLLVVCSCSNIPTCCPSELARVSTADSGRNDSLPVKSSGVSVEPSAGLMPRRNSILIAFAGVAPSTVAATRSSVPGRILLSENTPVGVGQTLLVEPRLTSTHAAVPVLIAEADTFLVAPVPAGQSAPPCVCNSAFEP